MKYLSTIVFVILLITGPGFAAGVDIAYYYGAVHYYASDAQTPRGQTVSLVKRTVDSSSGRIVEIVTQPDRNNPKRAVDFEVVLSRTETHGDFVVSNDMFRGAMKFAGASLNTWSYDINLTAGGFLRGDGKVTCHGIETNKEIQDNEHRVVLRMTEDLRPVSATEYERIKQSLHSTGGVSQIDCSAAYGEKPATCERVACDAKSLSFVGKWVGLV